MNAVLWVVTAFLAFAFLAAGAMKLVKSRSDFAESGMGWTEDFSPTMIKAIGTLEVLAALGLILPALFDVPPVLVPLAAVGLVLLMLGAAATHAKHQEGQMIAITIGLAVVAAVVAWGRFGAYSFAV